MLQNVESSKISIGQASIAIGLALSLGTSCFQVLAQEAGTSSTTSTNERLLLRPSDEDTTGSTVTTPAVAPLTTPPVGMKIPSTTPSFEELDSAASDLNEALSGARAKLDELRQATELASMAAELREELETSIQENNRLAATLAEIQSERTSLETQHNAAQREIIDLAQSADESKAEVADISQKLERRDARIDEIEDARIDAGKKIQSLELDLDEASNEIGQLNGDIMELTGNLETAQTELDEASSQAKLAREARDEADQELSKVRKQIAGMLRSVLLGGEPIDISALEEAEAAERESKAAAEALKLSARYEAVRASNVRSEPSPDADRVGFAKRGDFITVIGKVDGRNWFEIETANGIRGFIFGELIRPAA